MNKAADLTKRQREILRVALSFALSNVDDLNEALATDDEPAVTEQEVSDIASLLGFSL